MPVIGDQNILLALPPVGVVQFVPPALWGLVVGGGIVSGRWRTFTFLAAVLVGGVGLVLSYFGWTWEFPSSAMPAEAYGAVLLILGGAVLLVIGALTGLVALGLRQRTWGDQES